MFQVAFARWRNVAPVLAHAVTLVLTGGTLADTVELAGGDQINGRIVDRTETHLVVEHNELGLLRIPLQNIESIATGENDDPAAEARLAMLQEEATKADLWKGHFEFGGALSAGVTDEQSAHVGVKVKRETERHLTVLDAYYYYSVTDGDRTDNKFTTGVRHDWLMPDSKWFFFAQGRYDFDEFQSWEHRLSAHGGVGHHLIAKEKFDLKLRAGAGVIREFGSDDDDLRPEAILGADVAWEMTHKQSLEGTVDLYPDLAETGEFRIVSQAGWRMLIDEESNMSLRAGLNYEYQSKVDPGVDHNDLRLNVGLQFDF